MPHSDSFDRRQFLNLGLFASLASLAPGSARAQESPNASVAPGELRVLAVGVGNRAAVNIDTINSHPQVRMAGFCDIDTRTFERYRERHPDARYGQDYRTFFADHADEFDAVIVTTADHMHAPVMLTAMAHDKHVYSDKPLVQQLDELRLLRNAVAAKPQLVTQMSNQRACLPGKMEAAELLRSGQLGEVGEAWTWTPRMEANRYFFSPWMDEYPEFNGEKPAEIDWDLWLGCSTSGFPFHPGVVKERWRSLWEFGGGILGDWGPHLIDTICYGLDLRRGPLAIRTHAPREASAITFGTYLRSEMVFAGGPGIRGDHLPLTATDSVILPSFAAHGLPSDTSVENFMTLIDTDRGCLLISPHGHWHLYDGGHDITGEIERPEVTERHHWHDWVDNCLGADKPLWSPFEISSYITEAAIIQSKTSRFPGREMGWNSETCRFDFDEANETIVWRDYRDGFGIPVEFA